MWFVVLRFVVCGLWFVVCGLWLWLGTLTVSMLSATLS